MTIGRGAALPRCVHATNAGNALAILVSVEGRKLMLKATVASGSTSLRFKRWHRVLSTRGQLGVHSGVIMAGS